MPQSTNSNRNNLAELRATGQGNRPKWFNHFSQYKNVDSFRWPDLQILTPNTDVFNQVILLIDKDITIIKGPIIKEHQSGCPVDILYCQLTMQKQEKENPGAFVDFDNSEVAKHYYFINCLYASQVMLQHQVYSTK